MLQLETLVQALFFLVWLGLGLALLGEAVVLIWRRSVRR